MVYAVLGFVAAPLGDFHAHFSLMAPSIVVFTSSMAYAYAVPALSRLGSAAEAAGIPAVALLALYPAALYLGYGFSWLLYSAGALLLATLSAAGVAAMRSSLLKASYLHIALSYAVSAVLVPLALGRLGAGAAGMAAVYGLLLPMVYAVSYQSFSMTCGVKPVLWLLPVSTGLSLAAGALLLTGPAGLSSLLAALSTVLYALGARIYRAGRCARSGSLAHSYFAAGYVGVLASLIPVIYAALAGGDVYTMHMVAIAFIGMHIAVHAPMMVPAAAAGIPNARRYSIAPFLVGLSAAAAWKACCLCSSVFLIYWLALVLLVAAALRRARQY